MSTNEINSDQQVHASMRELDAYRRSRHIATAQMISSVDHSIARLIEIRNKLLEHNRIRGAKLQIKMVLPAATEKTSTFE